MNYSEIIQYIEAIERFGSKPGLERIKILLHKLGNPEKDLQVIHVAGTNGKGSTCTMIHYILQQAGYHVGIYTSPHLESYHERIRIDNEDITEQQFAQVGEKIIEKCREMENEGLEHPTVFECLTAMALVFFQKQAVDFVLLEVGLGGRFDATNVIEQPVVSVITSIGMDHMEFLGNTIKQIAIEKAGIIKKNCPAVLYFPSGQVYNIIDCVCKQNNSKLYYDDNLTFYDIKQDVHGTTFSIKNRYFSYEQLMIRMIGEHQMNNGAVALLVIEVLKEKGYIITDQQIKKGLAKAYWPGRMEFVDEAKTILLDGAHNEEGVKALEKVLKTFFVDRPITLLIGVLKDKSYEKMLSYLLPYVETVVLTEPNSPRKLSVDILEEKVKGYSAIIYKERNIKDALVLALKVKKDEGLLCCGGSLYLIGELKKVLKQLDIPGGKECSEC